MAALCLFPLSALITATQSPSLTVHSPKTSIPKLPSIKPKLPAFSSSHLPFLLSSTPSSSSRRRRKGGNSRKDFRVRADDDDVQSVSPDEYDMDIEEAEEVDNKKDYDVEYDRLFPSSPTASGGLDTGDDIAMVQSESFVSTQGWDSETVVDYKINEDEFHKISLLDCDFFIRRPPDPDNDVYDFREMYVTPPDTDVYAIPKVLAPMPEKYIRCSKSDYGRYNVTEPPIDAPRDPLYKSTKEILKCKFKSCKTCGGGCAFVVYDCHRGLNSEVSDACSEPSLILGCWRSILVFLFKHYRNWRAEDPDFFLDFEEIYVIDSKAKSITRAKVLVTVPEGRNRDRKKDLLTVRDNGTSFKIIPMAERDDPTTVIEREEWIKTRREIENHLRKLRDFDVSNWF